jgi:hypothetical protein
MSRFRIWPLVPRFAGVRRAGNLNLVKTPFFVYHDWVLGLAASDTLDRRALGVTDGNNVCRDLSESTLLLNPHHTFRPPLKLRRVE